MHRLRHFWFPALMALVVSHANSIDADLNTSESSTTNKRWNTLQDFSNWTLPWVAMGDSFSAAPGAGTKIDNDCERSDKGYPQQLQDSYWPSDAPAKDHPLQFLSCAGAVITDVIQKQLPQILKDGDIGIVTLSIGSNDILFSKILLSCVGGIPNVICDILLNTAHEILYSEAFWNRYEQLVDKIIARSRWPTLDIAFRHPVILQAGFPALFNALTLQCSSVTFNPVQGATEPKVTTVLRKKLNSLVGELNVMMAFFVARINKKYQQNEEGQPPSSVSPIIFVDQDDDYSGHRFCEQDTTEPNLDNPETWFFPMKNAIVGANAKEFSEVNTATCDVTAHERIDKLYQCYIAKRIKADPKYDLSLVTRPDLMTRAFNPTTEGMGAVAKAVQRTIQLKTSESLGYPLRILAAGDSNTVGSGSKETAGYRSHLNRMLNYGNEGQIQWVGQEQNGPPESKLYHEGYSGKTVSTLVQRFSESTILDTKPNVVLLMIGTNDIREPRNAGVQQTLDLLQELLTIIWAKSGASTLILVSTVIPIGLGTDPIYPMRSEQKKVMQYNAGLKNMVNELVTQGHNIGLVLTSVSWSDRFDSLHPNPHGYEKMAHDWYEAIWRHHQGNKIMITLEGKGDNNGLHIDPLGPIKTPQGESAGGRRLGIDMGYRVVFICLFQFLLLAYLEGQTL